MRSLLIVAMMLPLASLATAEQPPQLSLMPMPASVQMGSGQLPIDQTFSVATAGFHDASLDGAIHRAVTQLSRRTGMHFYHATERATNPTLLIRAEHGRERVQKVGEDESYELAVSETGARISAETSLGILRGLQTFLQLVQTTDKGFAIPVVTIKDQPRFPWRGLLIDVSRHFIPLDVLRRNLDGMEAVKMNVLHWHLSDDQGFRVESKRFPKLQEMGSDGLYYTQSEIRDFLAYAYDRGIRVLPEFDIPGHSKSWFVGYPELASGSGPYKLDSEPPESVIDPTKESTYKFLEKFVAEMAKLFPDAYFHIGGDEVDGKFWDANPQIQAFIRAHGMKTDQDLQAYFNQRLQRILAKNHKVMMGWDEILHPDLPKSIVVQSWRGQESLATATRQGYSGLLSFGYYLDLIWPAARHYAVDSMSGAAATLNAEEKSRILGGEACMWSELVSSETIDSRIWPRNAVIAERLWSRQEMTDVNSMYARLGELSWQLELLGLTHRSTKTLLLHRITGSDDITAARTLVDVVEPVKDYARMENIKGPWNFRAPLDRLVDAASPESDVARRFRDVVQTYVQGGYKDQAAEVQIRTWLTTWRDNDAKLKPLLSASFLLQEDAALSEDLSALGAAGLQALDYLDKLEPSPQSWRTQQGALINRAQSPKADLLLMVVSPIQQLVEASAGVSPGH